jgi:hypothetical protein
MNTQSPFSPTLLRSSALLLVFILISACSKTVGWKEEVQLSNGQMIVIERETKHRPGGAEWARGSGWKPEQYIIRFQYPPDSGRLIEWRSTKISPATYPEFPLLLDIEPKKDAPFLVSINWPKDGCYEYVRYVAREGSWVEDPLPTEFEPRAANLYLPAAGIDLPRKVTLALKRTENADIRYRQRMKQIGPKQTACGA